MQKIIVCGLIAFVIYLIVTSTVENFALTTSIVTTSGNSTVTVPTSPANTSQTPNGVAVITDPTKLNPAFYYVRGNINAKGQTALNTATAAGINSSIKCTIPTSAYIQLPATNAVCKTGQDAYTFPPDSTSVCTLTITDATGKTVAAKSGALKTEADRTNTVAYNGGQTCAVQQASLPPTMTIACGVTNPVCPTMEQVDNTYYDWSSTAVLGTPGTV